MDLCTVQATLVEIRIASRKAAVSVALIVILLVTLYGTPHSELLQLRRETPI